MKTSSKVLGQKIEFALESKSISVAEIAKHCDVSRQAVYSWISTGAVSKPMLRKIADRTGFPLAWWLDEAAPLTPQEEAARGVSTYEADTLDTMKTAFLKLSPAGRLMVLALLNVVATFHSAEDEELQRKSTRKPRLQVTATINQEGQIEQRNRHPGIPKPRHNRSA